MATWFTSDTHFGHAAIIRHCKRPFKNVAAMDAALISRWNATVAPGDTVYHLGDFAYWKGVSARDYARQLNGEIHLIAGNHDGDTVGNHAESFASISQMREVTVDEQRLFLCHYPMREWPGAWRGVWHLFGHVHGRLDHQPWGFSLDIGVDSHSFGPISFQAIAARIATHDNIFPNAAAAIRGEKDGSQ